MAGGGVEPVNEVADARLPLRESISASSRKMGVQTPRCLLSASSSVAPAPTRGHEPSKAASQPADASLAGDESKLAAPGLGCPASKS